MSEVKIVGLFEPTKKQLGDKTYLIPANQAIGNTMRLRLTPAKNNQEKGIKWAKEYEL